MNLRPCLAASLTAIALLTPSRSHAFERQWHVGASLGYTALLGDHATLHGFGGGAHLTYGLNDAINLLAAIDVSAHVSRLDDPPVDATGMATGAPPAKLPTTLLASGGVGVGYVVDVLQWVPYVGLLAGPADVVNLSGTCGGAAADATTPPTPCHSLRLDLEVPFGLDYSLSRSFAIGVGGRYQLLLLGPAVEHALSGFVRAEYVWGY